ncbi:MAG: helix-turn-helix domain-containing protein [Lactobacillus crispatus]|nr:helix-turn-helix domain-containing protein [Lactobacillus crispatus]MCT7769789.1 helix-turn-helix domain-containing protein [Lactobacillus crispatus]
MAYLKIEDACKAKNITLKDLSRLSGISERSLEWYVKQQREPPSLSRVEKLAKVLEVSPAWLVSWE